MRPRLGIYIHIPFCASKCSYCDFYSLSGCDYLMDEYQDALIEHIEESAHSIQNYEVDSIYFGGGTPSYYGAERLMESGLHSTLISPSRRTLPLYLSWSRSCTRRSAP